MLVLEFVQNFNTISLEKTAFVLSQFFSLLAYKIFCGITFVAGVRLAVFNAKSCTFIYS